MSLPVIVLGLVTAIALGACSQGEGVAPMKNDVHSAPNSLEQVLAAALDDERKAEATYQAVIDRHGPVRPFINIIEAERRHAQMIIDLMRSRGMAIPTNRWAGEGVAAPSTVAQACSEGVIAERENVALYDRLLPTVSDPEAREVLNYLQAASRNNHLPALERCGGARGGRGPGGGMGRR